MALLWALLALVAGVLMLVLWPFERAPRVTGWVRDARGTPQPLPDYQRDEGDETDVAKDIATEGLGVTSPYVRLRDSIQVRNPLLSRTQIGAIIMARARLKSLRMP